MKNLVIVTGPTGVGKTDFVDKLVKKGNFEVVNIDMGQFYEPLKIGTAKPNYQNSSYKQHLFDIVKEPQNFTVSQYRDLVLNTVNELWSKSITPILVGGSGFYIHSLFFPPKVDFEQASELEIDFSSQSNEELWKELNLIDSKRALQINLNDRYRLERALTLWRQFFIKPSEFAPKLDLFADNVFMFVLTRERENLYKRINQRTEQMINEGWIQEVENLDNNWKDFLKVKKIIGYDDIINFLEVSNIGKKELVGIIQQKTRNYAKRQITFFKKLCKEIQDQDSKNHVFIDHINLEDKNCDLYINQLSDKIFPKKGKN